jgi:CDP-ribitol ribitolphosphotransferase
MKILILIMNFFYFFIKLFPTRNKITLISRQSNSTPLDFKLLKEELEKEYEIVILPKKLETGIINKIKYIFHMFRQMYHIATSKVVLLDSYCMVVSILKHKKRLKIIQMWHSMGTMKKFGYAVLDYKEGSNSKVAYAMKMHKNYDYIFASGDAYKEHLASGFNYTTDNILTFPLPRYDLLKDKSFEKRCRDRILKEYPILATKKNIIYCPTFRKYECEFSKHVNELVNSVDTNKYNLIVKLHPLEETKIDVENSSIIVDNKFSTFDMLAIADYIISDYSCVIYEAAVKNIALYFYNFDYDVYLENRGLAIDYYNELPGVISKNPKDIIKDIENNNYDYAKLKKFSDKYVELSNGATKNIVDFIFKIMV